MAAPWKMSTVLVVCIAKTTTSSSNMHDLNDTVRAVQEVPA